jgi:hypothetical protein
MPNSNLLLFLFLLGGVVAVPQKQNIGPTGIFNQTLAFVFFYTCFF